LLPLDDSDEEAAEVVVTSERTSGAGMPAPLRTPPVSSMPSDFEIAIALQMEEGNAAVQEMEQMMARGAAAPEPRQLVLYVVELSSSPVRCFACGEPVPRQALRVIFQRSAHRRLTSAHLSCLPQIEGLVRPSCAPRAPRNSHTPVAESAVLMNSSIPEPERRAAMTCLVELPAGPRAIQLFEWPQPPRQPSRRTELRNQLMLTDRDFTSEDYELLLQLDGGAGPGRRGREEGARQAQAVLARLPVSRLAEASPGTQCSICLDDLVAGAEVRTLPCMHVFHRKCIDRWFMTPGGKPRCPIDQAEVET